MKITRIRAFATHLTVSATLVALVSAITIFIWYPAPYLYVNAADKILLLLMAVDVLAGPTLTLIVFKPGKPGLKMDMTAIIIVQLAALIYGTATLYRERPLFIVFAVDRFEVVTASQIDVSKIRFPELKNLPFAGPALAVAEKPKDRELRQKIMMEALFRRGPDIDRRPELYEPYANYTEKVVAKSKSINKLVITDSDRKALSEFLRKHGGQQADFAYIPLVGKDFDREMLMAVSRTSGLPVGGIRINPWSDNTGTKQKTAPKKPNG